MLPGDDFHPQSAAQRYAQAVKRAMLQAIYAMLTKSSQRRYGLAGTQALVAGSARELRAQASALAGPGVEVQATAELRFADGESVVLVLDEGRFRVGSAGTLPAQGSTVPEALAALRRALSERSYSALLRLLSAQTRAAIERDLGSLVEGLEHPESLELEEDGDAASVSVPGGHIIKLRREGGVWRVEDFD